MKTAFGSIEPTTFSICLHVRISTSDDEPVLRECVKTALWHGLKFAKGDHRFHNGGFLFAFFNRPDGASDEAVAALQEECHRHLSTAVEKVRRGQGI